MAKHRVLQSGYADDNGDVGSTPELGKKATVEDESRSKAALTDRSGALLNKARGGDRRSIGRSDEVAREVLRNPELLAALFKGMLHDDALIRMRAADVCEKVTRDHTEWLQPFKGALLGDVAALDQAEVQWHVAQMLPRLELTPLEQRRAVTILLRYLDDDSRIVKTCCLEALAAFASRNRRLLARVLPILKRLTTTGSPAMRSRGRRLLAAFGHK
jgi:hypothetical protein